MIAETQTFFIDVLTLIPIDKSLILIQSPHDEVLDVLKKMNFKDVDGVFKSIELNKRNREILTDEIIYNNIEEFIHNLEIIVKGEKIFEGYDGMEYGLFSKKYNLPKDFELKYKEKDMYMISKDW